MNIYMTGAHGCGKTTTAIEIKKKNDGFGLIPSASRTSPYEPGTEDHQQYVMKTVYQHCAKYDQTIHERTPLDVFAYTSVGNFNNLREEQAMKLENFLRCMRHSGDTLFYFPILFPLEEDGVRPDGLVQAQIDDFIHDVLERENVLYKTVPMGTPEERADFILKELPGAKL